MIRQIEVHWPTIVVAASWLVSHLRRSIPARGTPRFWTAWAYNIVSGDLPAKATPA